MFTIMITQIPKINSHTTLYDPMHARGHVDVVSKSI